MTQTLGGGGIEDLRVVMHGPVCVSGDAGYDEARSIWNGDIDRHPAVVARCTSRLTSLRRWGSPRAGVGDRGARRRPWLQRIRGLRRRPMIDLSC